MHPILLINSDKKLTRGSSHKRGTLPGKVKRISQ